MTASLSGNKMLEEILIAILFCFENEIHFILRKELDMKNSDQDKVLQDQMLA